MADEFKFVNGQYTVDTREIPNGAYYLIISAKNQPLTYKKIIVMHRQAVKRNLCLRGQLFDSHINRRA